MKIVSMFKKFMFPKRLLQFIEAFVEVLLLLTLVLTILLLEHGDNPELEPLTWLTSLKLCLDLRRLQQLMLSHRIIELI
jgi:hypothetical protein